MTKRKQPIPSKVQKIAPIDLLPTKLKQAFELHKKGDYVGAVTYLKGIISSNPPDWRLLYQYADSLCKLRKFDEARLALDEAVRLNDHHAQTYNLRGITLLETGKHLEATVDFEQALKIDPNFLSCYVNLSIAFERGGYYSEAIFCCKTALAKNKKFTEAWINLGTSYIGLGDLPSAIDAFEQVLSYEPNFTEAHYNRSLCYLMGGNFLDGWAEYEWRTKRKQAPITLRNFKTPKWDGTIDASKLLFVWPEQGIGDEIFFGTMFRDLIDQQKNVFFEVDKRLLPIFKRSFPQTNFVPRGFNLTNEIFDFQIPIGSLGQYLRPNHDSFLSSGAYLVADQERAAKIRNNICTDRKMLIGISWISKNEKSGIFRSIPLKRLLECFEGFDVKLVSLQYGDTATDMDAHPVNGSNIESAEFIDKFNDIDGLFSLIESCDLVISIDNSTIHFSAAIGKPTFVLLPTTPDWRWGQNGTTTPWYDSIRLFRQTQQNDWTNVIQDVRSTLKLIFEAE